MTAYNVTVNILLITTLIFFQTGQSDKAIKNKNFQLKNFQNKQRNSFSQRIEFVRLAFKKINIKITGTQNNILKV